jgi:hypothetical protein
LGRKRYGAFFVTIAVPRSSKPQQITSSLVTFAGRWRRLYWMGFAPSTQGFKEMGRFNSYST